MKSSKGEDKKTSKKGDEITIVVDGEQETPGGSPTKDLTSETAVENDQPSPNAHEPALEPEPEICPSDATRLTEIIVKRYDDHRG